MVTYVVILVLTVGANSLQLHSGLGRLVNLRWQVLMALSNGQAVLWLKTEGSDPLALNQLIQTVCGFSSVMWCLQRWC